jgi:FkbM family methyltransferase
MYQKFKWTKIGNQRNDLLKRYEPIQPYIFVELARNIQADTFIDIGANIGAYSIFLSSLDCIEKIYSFEAAPATFEELDKNVRLNDHVNKIKIFNTAISDSEKKLRFGIIGEYSGANSIIGTSIHETDKFVNEILVDCVPLDTVITEKSKKLCMKIDVEGHEREVVIGARNTLHDNEAIIQIENYDENDSSLSDLFESYGYKEIISIGPDMYFTNMQEYIKPEAIIEVFERAAAELIKSNLEATPADLDQPVKVRLLNGVAVELSGSSARFARQMKDKLRPRHP